MNTNKDEVRATDSASRDDLQDLADKVVIANATGNESLFLPAVQELLAAVRLLKSVAAPVEPADVMSKVIGDAIHGGTGIYRVDPAEFFKEPADTAPVPAAGFDSLMALVQAYASTWSLVGGPFDNGTMNDEALKLKDELRQHLVAALSSVAQQNPTPIVHLAGGSESADTRATPNACPITRRPFFMDVWHDELGMVSTYGGPFDSYSYPYLDDDGDLRAHHYDHDRGEWIEGGIPLGYYLTSEQPEDIDLPHWLDRYNEAAARSLAAYQTGSPLPNTEEKQ